MPNRQYRLIAVMTAALLVSVAIPIGWPTGVVRTIAAAALVLLLPGYSLSMLLLPELRSGWRVRLPFAIGLSMAATVLGGLVLNLMPWGIGTQGWIAWLCGLTLVAGGIALARTRSSPEFPRPRAATIAHKDGVAVVPFLPALAVTILAVAVAGWGAAQRSEANSTQLWLLPAKQANPKEIQFGIRSLEVTARSYRLQLLSEGQLLGEWRPIIVAPGGHWEAALSLPPDGSGPETVEALLYDAEGDVVYRRAVLRQLSWSSIPSP